MEKIVSFFALDLTLERHIIRSSIGFGGRCKVHIGGTVESAGGGVGESFASACG